jgi:hypothetical protein
VCKNFDVEFVRAGVPDGVVSLLSGDPADFLMN